MQEFLSNKFAASSAYYIHILNTRLLARFILRKYLLLALTLRENVSYLLISSYHYTLSL